MKNEFEQLFELSIDMLSIVDYNGVFLRVNEAWANTLGYAVDEIIGQHYERFVYSGDLEFTQHIAEEFATSKQQIQFENRYVNKDGGVRWLSWTAIRNDELQRIFCVTRDVTEAKQTQLQLLLRNQAIEASPTSVVIADLRAPDMPLIYVNPAFERITGYSADEAIGRNCRFLQGDDRDQPGIIAIRAAIKERRAVTVVLRNYRKDGRMFYNELNVAPIYNDGVVTHYVGIASDVTKRVLAEEKVQSQNQELVIANYHLAMAQQNAQMASEQIQQQNAALLQANEELAQARREAEQATRLKSQFLATISHELRTPLNAIIGYTEIQLAGMTGELNEEQHDYQERVLVNAEHLLRLINDILDISKIESGRLDILHHPFYLRHWLDEVVAQTKGLAEAKSLNFIVSLDERLPNILVGDEARIKQVVINLLSNAIKFTDGGFVKLLVRKHGADAWRLMVEDSGIGIPSHMQETIFEEFRQVDSSSQRKQGGTGLGLSIVRKLTLMMGGNVRVQSQLGHGSTFTVVLPLDEPSTQEREAFVKGQSDD